MLAKSLVDYRWHLLKECPHSFKEEVSRIPPNRCQRISHLEKYWI
jgi:hypothetical protein